MFQLLGSLIMGAFCGAIAGKLMNREGGLVRNIVLGLLGSAVGGFLFSLVGLGATGFLGNLLVSVVGACVCIWVGDRFF